MEKVDFKITDEFDNIPVTRVIKAEIENFGSLGKEIKISPKAKVNINKSGYRTEFFTPTVELNIGIGNDHIATLVMSKDAWEELKKGTPIDITTLKEFKQNFL